jgi:hypothetical protein
MHPLIAQALSCFYREQMLAHAAAERQARQLPRARPRHVRLWIGLVLLRLGSWLVDAPVPALMMPLPPRA